ncbi:hypothetical protein ACJJTC_008791 [Scirpophaga incertulas]
MVPKQYLLSLAILLFILLQIKAKYNKDVVCIIDKNKEPICHISPKTRRGIDLENNNIPSHDPYIPRANPIFYNCSSTECATITLHSMTQVTSPELQLKSCYQQVETYFCETIRYNHFKSIDKLLFLTNNVRDKMFYLVDCLVYSDRGRVCHKKDDADSHIKLVDTGTIVRPNEENVLSQDEFLCEQNDSGVIHCDPSVFVPYNTGIKIKDTMDIKDDILLKTGNYFVTLTKNCIDDWCGYSGILNNTRRASNSYLPPGGKTYNCYYAYKQQICLPLYDDRLAYDGRNSFS